MLQINHPIVSILCFLLITSILIDSTWRRFLNLKRLKQTFIFKKSLLYKISSIKQKNKKKPSNKKHKFNVIKITEKLSSKKIDMNNKTNFSKDKIKHLELLYSKRSTIK